MLLKNKTAIVTGAAVGIGREIAVAFAREGASVVVNYSKSKIEAEETLHQILEVGGKGALCQANVEVAAQTDQLAQFCVDQFGSIDILVNNAAITRFIPFPQLELADDGVWDSLYNINVKGTFFCCRAVSKAMRGRSGAIINLASQAALRPMGSSIPYSVSKAAVIHLTKCLAVTLAPDIRVNCISPGVIEDTRWNAANPSFNPESNRDANIPSTPLNRLGKPFDIAQAAVYLASENSSYITGAILPVDGGRTL